MASRAGCSFRPAEYSSGGTCGPPAWSAGLVRRPRDPIRPCAFKEHLIHAGEDTPYYVRERFNPDVVPAI